MNKGATIFISIFFSLSSHNVLSFKTIAHNKINEYSILAVDNDGTYIYSKSNGYTNKPKLSYFVNVHGRDIEFLLREQSYSVTGEHDIADAGFFFNATDSNKKFAFLISNEGREIYVKPLLKCRNSDLI